MKLRKESFATMTLLMTFIQENLSVRLLNLIWKEKCVVYVANSGKTMNCGINAFFAELVTC